MRHTTFIPALLVAGLLAAACSKENGQTSPEGSPVTLSVISGVRTSLGENSSTVLWSADDKIGLVCVDAEGTRHSGSSSCPEGLSIADSETCTPSSSADFTGTISDGLTPYYAAYPLVKTTTHSSYDYILLNTIKTTQEGIVGNVTAGAPMVGKVEKSDGGYSCQMKNVGCLMRFEVVYENYVSKVRIDASKGVSGNVYAYPEAGEGYSAGDIERYQSSGTKYVELVPAEGLDYLERGVYWFVCGTGTYESSTLSVTTPVGTFCRSFPANYTFQRNQRYTLGSDAALSSQTLDVTFSTGSTVSWSLYDQDGKQASNTTSDDTHFKVSRNSGSDTTFGPLYTSIDKDSQLYPFSLVVKSGSSDYKVTGKGGLNMYVSGDAITIPAGPEGFGLKSINVRNGQNETSIDFVRVDGSSETTLKNFSWSKEADNVSRNETFTIDYPVHSEYKLVANAKAGILGFSLVYEKLGTFTNEDITLGSDGDSIEW